MHPRRSSRACTMLLGSRFSFTSVPVYKNTCTSWDQRSELPESAHRTSVPSYLPAVCGLETCRAKCQPGVWKHLLACGCLVCVWGFFLRSFKHASLQTFQARISNHLYTHRNSQNHSSGFHCNDTVTLCSWSTIWKASFGKTETLLTFDI